MPARAMWKARMVVGDLSVPVKLYAAVQDAKVHFRLLHADDQAPVKQVMVDPVEHEPVARDAAVRAMELDKGLFVRLSDEELAQVEPQPSREIELERVVPAQQLDERWLDRPYYLGPDGDEECYAALAEALGASRAAQVNWTMRRKRYAGWLRAKNHLLVLQTLRHLDELANLDAAWPSFQHQQLDAREKRLAEQLVAMLQGPFEPNAFEDEYQQRVRELVAAKAQGKVVQLPKQPERAPDESLFDSLQASLERMRKVAGG